MIYQNVYIRSFHSHRNCVNTIIKDGDDELKYAILRQYALGISRRSVKMLIFITIACLITQSYALFGIKNDADADDASGNSTVICPIGFYRNGDQCVSLNSCPSGFKSVNGKCVPKDIECPVGYRAENGTCVSINLPIVCPAGTKLENGKCIADSTIVQCPPGFKAYYQICIPDQTSQCPTGYNYFNNLGCFPATHNYNYNCNPFNILNGGHCQPAVNIDPCLGGGFQSPCYGGYSGIFGYRRR